MAKKSWPEEIYHKIAVADLILIALHQLESSKKKADFEGLLKTCFNLFPEKLGFSKHPRWPDARKISRPLRSLRKQKLISGSAKKIFSINQAGRKRALEAVKLLRQRKLRLK